MSGILRKIICLMVVASCICVLPVCAGKVMSGDIFFETDFQDFNGLADSEARRWYFVDLDYGTEAWTTDAKIDEVVESDGNVAMSISNTSTTKNGKVQLRFTLNKADNITRAGGKLYIAYETQVSEKSGQSLWRYESIDEGSGKSIRYLFYMDYPAGLFYANNDDFFQWGNKANSKALELDTRYFVEQVIDFENGMYYSFVNGEALNPVSIANINENIGLLEFSIIGGVEFLDNLKVAYMTEDSFSAKTTVVDEKTVTVKFTEGLSSDDLILNAEIINTLTNEKAVIEEIKKKDVYEYEIKLKDAIIEGDEYCIVTDGDITNILGKSIPPVAFSKSAGDSKLYISKAEVISYDGESVRHYESIDSPSKKIKITFTDKLKDVPAGITSDAGNIKSVTLSEDKRAVVVEFEEYFFGNGNYTLNIPSGIEGEGGKVSSKAYGLPIKTGEEVAKFLNFGFYKDGVAVSAEDLSDGDEITLSVDIIKTIKGKYPVILSYSGWKNQMMTEFNFKDLTLSENETSKSGSIKIVYDKENNIKLQGFLRKGLSLINPLTNHINL